MLIAHLVRNGFSLLELMLTITIVAILASIAYPSYKEHVAKSRRTDAQSALLQIAQFMEKNYTATGTYQLPSSAASLPFTSIPQDSNNSYYTISLSNVTSTTFTVIATRTGGMLGDWCGDFTLNQAGTEGNININGSITVDMCW